MKIYKLAIYILLLNFVSNDYSYSQEQDTSFQTNKIENIIIKSSRIISDAKDIGSSIYVISKDQIKSRGFKNAIDAISSAPGVTSKQNGSFGGVGTVRIRGASSSQTLVLIDGVPVNDASSVSYTHLTLPTSDLV